VNFTYNFVIVALSVFVAIQASYVGLNLARYIPGAFALNRRMLIAGSALSLAVGIWGMHFVGMLAVVTPIRIDYAILPTLISFLVCVLVTGVAVYLASMRAHRMTVIAAALMGSGIAAMHFIGMMAVSSSTCMVSESAFYVLASVAVAIAASGLALWLAFTTTAKPPFWLCAVILGGAISGMHYTAMAGTTLSPIPENGPTGEALSRDLLAIIVSVVAFSISGIFMLTLIPNEIEESQEDETTVSFGNRSGETKNIVMRADLEPIASDRKINNNSRNSLPIEKHGARLYIAFTEVVSVHANSHYTYVFNGSDDLFCPLSISEIADLLPKHIFFRTHRSYIVNLAHVTNVKRAGDAGVAELNSAVRRTAPISRGRLAALRMELAGRQEDPGSSRS
jgi:diguanylate cyclase